MKRDSNTRSENVWTKVQIPELKGREHTPIIHPGVVEPALVQIKLRTSTIAICQNDGNKNFREF